MDNIYKYICTNPRTGEESEFNFEKYNQGISSTTTEELVAKTEGRLDLIMN